MRKQRILILGAGIAGLTLGRQLMARHDVDIIEKADRLHTSGTGIMLGINAMQIMQKLKLAEAIKAAGRELQGFTISDHRGKALSTLTFSESVRNQDLGLYGIHRNRLSELLYRDLEPFTRFNTTVSKLYEDPYSVYVEMSDGSCKSYDLVIAADGIYSATRRELAPTSKLRYSGYTCWRYMIDASPNDRPVEMWGRGRRLGIVPLDGAQTYVFVVANAEANSEDLDSLGAERMQSEFGYFGDIAPEVLERLPDARLRVHNDLYDLPTPVLGKGRILLIGDAAHATTPNMGQGAGMAIEDAWVLTQIIDQAVTIDEIVDTYTKRRGERVRKIVNMSYTLGRVAHWQSPAATMLRNRLLAMFPDGLNTRHMERLLLSY